MNTLNRRALIARALCFGGVATMAPVLARAGNICVAPESEELRASLNYTPQATDPTQSCARCAFFTADAAGTGCGNCTILSGPADAGGHCESWSPPD